MDDRPLVSVSQDEVLYTRRDSSWEYRVISQGYDVCSSCNYPVAVLQSDILAGYIVEGCSVRSEAEKGHSIYQCSPKESPKLSFCDSPESTPKSKPGFGLVLVRVLPRVRSGQRVMPLLSFLPGYPV